MGRALAQLPALHCLDISECRIDRRASYYLGDSLAFCIALQDLRYTGNEGIYKLLYNLRKFITLTSLVFTDDCPSKIPEYVQNCTSLKVLKISPLRNPEASYVSDDDLCSEEYFEPWRIHAWVTCISSRLTGLEELMLPRFNLYGADMAIIPDRIVTVTALTKLDFSRFHLREKSGVALGTLLTHLPHLEHLRLDRNLGGINKHQDDSAFQHFSESLGGCSARQTLNLNCCRIGVSGARALSAVVSRLTQLTYLCLGWINLQGKAEDVAAFLPDLSRLKCLDLRGNELDDNAILCLLSPIGGLSCLQRLILSHNSFSDEGMAAVTPELVKLACLTFLELEEIALDTDGVDVFSQHLSKTTSLRALN